MQHRIKEIARRVRHQVLLTIQLGKGRLNSGYCTICDCDVLFNQTGPWLRDQYLCMRCGSIPRQRALLKVLNDHIPGWWHLRIHESSPAVASSDKF
jgi:predicted metal-dependent hydrolase